MSPQQEGAIRNETVHLPEFGIDLNTAMCRNPMCRNFGIPFEGEIPNGQKQVTTAPYVFSLVDGALKSVVGKIECRDCGQTSRVLSNRAVRPIARYFLSLSMPFADCPDPQCAHHGINLVENWTSRTSLSHRCYRRENEHLARCRACLRTFPIGEPFGVRTKLTKEERAIKREELKEKAEATKRQQEGEKKKGERVHTQSMEEIMEALLSLEDDRKRRRVRASWGGIIEGVRTQRSVTDSIEVLGIGVGNYYRYLDQIGARLRDYHAYRNAKLLYADILGRSTPIRVYTDVLELSLRARRRDARFVSLGFVVSVVPIEGTIFVLAAHPFFLPDSLCPDPDAREADRGPQINTKWSCLLHSPPDHPDLSTKQREKGMPTLGRGGCFIRSPYAALAHFMVVQKMLARFDRIYLYMDSAKELYTGALLAFRDRILAGRPDGDSSAGRGRRASAEIVLFQHDKDARKRGGRYPKRIKRTPERDGNMLDEAWEKAERRFLKRVKKIVPKDLLKDAIGVNDSKLQAQVYRRAFKGANSKKGKSGGWAWLRYPPPSIAYRKPRILWLTRMPGKTYFGHGRDALLKATLQPVDSIFNSARARIAALSRPLNVVKGRGYRKAYFRPSVVLGELSIYLLGRNYLLRRKSEQVKIPAVAMGLAKSTAVALPRPEFGDTDDVAPANPRAAPRHETNLDLAKVACDFRLGISHARRISRWRQR